jgi:enterochelin esterase-like enzyme
VAGLTAIHLLTGWLPTTIFCITLLGLIAVCATTRRQRYRKNRHARSNRHAPYAVELAIAGIGAVVGGVLIWLMSDVWMVFGVSVGWVVMVEVTIAFSLISLSITVVFDSRGARRVIAIALVPLLIISCAFGIDMVYGEYTTIGSLFNAKSYATMKTTRKRVATISISAWQKLAREGKTPTMPEQGEMREVDIKPTRSRFVARATDVYLPPAALSSTPPALPVMVMLAGQPGSPDRFFEASGIIPMLNAYASKHHGLAPIVVSPDQNGASNHNSLCSDTLVYGNAETYLTQDVTNWITGHLPTSTSPDHWLIGGFSQGGTCSTQLGPAHPDIYGHIFAVDGELEPTDISRENTIKRFFGGDVQQYLYHVPIHIISAHAPSGQTLFSSAGSWDKGSQHNQLAIDAAARFAGMNVTTVISKNSGHDWHAVQTALAPELDLFCQETGLGKMKAKVSEYPNIEIVNLPTSQS